MKKIYLLFVLFSCCLFADAQSVKSNVSALEEMQVKVLKFYPNPATTFINFEFQKPVDKNYTLQIYNFLGKKVFEQIDLSQKNVVTLNEFFRGVYIFQLRDRTGKIVESGKFQVVK